LCSGVKENVGWSGQACQDLARYKNKYLKKIFFGGWGEGSGDPYFFNIFHLVGLRLHNDTQLPKLSKSALKV
jgi:hypothetical protein